MRALSIAHQRDAGPGVFADVIRAAGVEHDVWFRAETDEPPADPAGYDGVLVFGGAMHADQEAEHAWLRDEKALLKDLLARQVPMLGVCLGSQLLAAAAGAQVRRATRPEIGWHAVEVTDPADPVVGPLAPRFEAFQWHSYEAELPPGAAPLARSDVCLQAYRVGDRAWGIQFHAEVTRADAQAWIDDYRSDEDAVRIGIDPDALRRRTLETIDGWNALGRALCERWLRTI